MWLHVRMRAFDAGIHCLEDMQAAFAGLFQSFAHSVHAEAVYLYIHLYAANALTGTRDLKIHIAEMIFVTQDIGEDGIFPIGRARNKPHRYSAYVLRERNAGIHQSQAACANRSHGGGTVGFQDIAYYPYGVRIITARHHLLEGAHGQVAMSYFPAALSPHHFHFTGAERREIIVQEEFRE